MSDSRAIEVHQPCPCGDSSDAYAIYDDGHGYCFSCSKNFPGHNTGLPIIVSSSLSSHSDDALCTFEYRPWRGVSKDTMAFFEVKTKIDAFGKPVSIGFPYGNDSFKIRNLESKKFHSTGAMSNATLFGKSKFSAGSARAITITEGELDALSTFQVLGSRYPAVSVRSASSARADCSREREYLNSFEKIYLCFDNDEPGQKAVREVAALFDFNKVYHVKMSQYKDANEYLTNGKEAEFKALWFNAKRFLPEGIISQQAEFDNIIDNNSTKEGVPYPFKRVQEMTYGIRTGETVLLTALEGIGKTEVVRAIEYHLLNITDASIGIIHLEESKARALQGLAGYRLQSPVHLPDSQVSKEAVKVALRDLVKRDERLHIYSHFGSSDPDVILDTIRFLVTACGCRYIFLDHITMVVSGLGDEDERKMLDYISTRLAMMVEELDFSLIFVSHVNDEGKTRGSRNISKIADLWIHLDRDQQATSLEERNTTHLTIRKNRFGAQTGPAGKLVFSLETFMVTEYDPQAMPAAALPPIGI